MGPGGEIDLSLLTVRADAAAAAGDAPAAQKLYATLLQAHQQASGPTRPTGLERRETRQTLALRWPN